MGDDGPDRDLEALGERLRRARPDAPAPGHAGPGPTGSGGRAAGLAFRVGVELVSALAVGVAIGWFLDAWLGTRPWLLLVFILLGGAAGVLNVYRVTRGYGYSAGYGNDKQSGDRDPGDRGPGIEG